MGRVGNILSGVAKSSLSLGPLDAVFAGLDYADGKAQGEDNIRAAAGAAGSVAGGWGGAAAGAAIGTMAIPIPVVGTAIGAIAGGMAGSFGGGWGADRVDEAVRGNQGASAAERNNERNLATTAGIGAGAVGAGVLAKKNMNADDLRYQQALAQKRGINLNNTQAAGAALKSSGGAALRSTLNTAKQLPLKQMGIGGALIAGGAAVNNMMSNPVGGAIDALTGNAMNLRQDDGPNYGADREAGRYNPSTAAYNAMNDAERSAQLYADRSDFVYNRNKADQKEMMELAFVRKQQYEQDADKRKYNYDLGINQQKFDAEREIEFAGLQADQATNRLEAYTKAGQDATNQLSAILGARYF